MTKLLNDKQNAFCLAEANKIAKILMEKDVSSIFHKDGNANFVMNVITTLTAGTISLLSKQIGWSTDDFLEAFVTEVKRLIKEKSINPIIKVLQ